HDLVGEGAQALNDPTTRDHVGNSFLFERGYSIVWSGWEADVAKSGATMGAWLPLAMADGKPVVRRIRAEVQVGKRIPAGNDTLRLSYPTTSMDQRTARLTMRARDSDPRVEIPAYAWEFADARSIRLWPRGTPFEPTAIYELWYDAVDSRIAGVGFAATRDVVSFLRYERADRRGRLNPLLVTEQGRGIRHAMAFGGSQSGRFLRHYIELG